MRRMGVDVAHEGSDSSCCVICDGCRVLHIEAWTKADIPTSADKAERLFQRFGGITEIVVDCDGLGVGVRDILRLRGYPTVAFHGQARTENKDASGELGYYNKRSEAWWNLRVLLDPHNGHNMIIPKDDVLLGDMVCPKWSVENQKIKVESKPELMRRLKRSPDRGDALAMCLCPGDASSFEENFRILTAADVEALAQQNQRRDPRSEEAQLDAMMWGGAHQNFDLFGDL